jgi:hypothetical protein
MAARKPDCFEQAGFGLDSHQGQHDLSPLDGRSGRRIHVYSGASHSSRNKMQMSLDINSASS